MTRRSNNEANLHYADAIVVVDGIDGEGSYRRVTSDNGVDLGGVWPDEVDASSGRVLSWHANTPDAIVVGLELGLFEAGDRLMIAKAIRDGEIEVVAANFGYDTAEIDDVRRALRRAGIL